VTDDARVRGIVAATPWLVAVLEAVQGVAPPNWCVAAGAVRNTVWDALTGRRTDGPSGDIDVVYFDPTGSDADRDEYQARLRTRFPAYDFEVTNQATVHLWQSHALGHAVAPYPSLAVAIGAWPETATAVGVTLDVRSDISVIAPLGLADLLALTVRENLRCPDRRAYADRLERKRWQDRWPDLTIVPSDAP
jgi:hypothetical protein